VADNQRVTQVLNHLIDNARKFSDDGQIDVFIDIDENGDQPASDTSSVRFAVKDDGIGIPEHKIEALFTDLEQVDGSMSRRYGGSGLGLTLTRQLIKLMGGELHVESIEGKGSTFAAVLPFALAKDDCQENMGAADFSDVSVLVAEDNPVNQVVLEAMLEELGCQVTLADDGGEALVAMTGTDFDMVFMDCQMPEMDGLEATSAARRQGVEVPIVAITANALYGDRERCIESGMNDYVTKPVTQRTIVNLLDRWAGERQRPLTAVGE